jgi:6-phosphofructokinase 1
MSQKINDGGDEVMKKKRIALLTSGGDAPGMNAAIRAVVRKALYHKFDVVGVNHGYQGLINGEFIQMKLKSVAGIINRGGTMLKSARSKQFMTEEGFGLAISNIKEHNIDVIVVIGGDGSMAGARKLSNAGITTLVIPATIDRDMMGTEYTLGFDTALNTILEAVNKIKDTSFSHDRVAIIEVMGRNAGHLALMAGIACGAETILIPEIDFDIDSICEGLVCSFKRGKQYSILMMAEGVGTGSDIAAQIASRTNFLPSVTVLGYLQRGGNPSAMDNIIGSRMGVAAVDNIILNKVNCLISMQHGNINAVPYNEIEEYKMGIDLSLQEMASTIAI